MWRETNNPFNDQPKEPNDPKVRVRFLRTVQLAASQWEQAQALHCGLWIKTLTVSWLKPTPINHLFFFKIFLKMWTIFKVFIEYFTTLLLFYFLGFFFPFFFFFFALWACGILASQPGIELSPPALEGKVLTTGPPRKSLNSFLPVDFTSHCVFRKRQFSSLVSLPIMALAPHVMPPSFLSYSSPGKWQALIFNRRCLGEF